MAKDWLWKFRWRESPVLAIGMHGAQRVQKATLVRVTIALMMAVSPFDLRHVRGCICDHNRDSLANHAQAVGC
jgi:hypothetical protein